MTTAVHEPSFVIDIVYEPAVSRPAPAARPPKERTAARLQLIQRTRARAAAEEAEFILRLAELSPDDDDPPPDSPGAKKTYWRTGQEFPGVSEFFVSELAVVLNVGRGTAAFRARRAFCWRDSLPGTFAALQRGDVGERRGLGGVFFFGGCPRPPGPRGRAPGDRGGGAGAPPQPPRPGGGKAGRGGAP